MNGRQEFLRRLRERTTAHLSALASESAQLFADSVGLGETGVAIYRRLIDQFSMDGAQEAGACLVALFSHELDDGAVSISDREFRALELVRDEFAQALPADKAAMIVGLLGDFH